MGREVEAALKLKGHSVAAIVDPFAGQESELTAEMAEKADGVIEFSLPDTAIANAEKYAELKLKAVVGTTGWYDELPKVREMIEKAGAAYLYGSNFSIGAHLFFHLVGKAAKLINPFPEYDIMGYEIHHKMKKDSPSGTALTTANRILENNQRKNTLLFDRCDREIQPDELHFASIRGGAVPGVHKVLIDSVADTIEISHTARGRMGFAMGSVLALEWLLNKKTGFYNVDDFINESLA